MHENDEKLDVSAEAARGGDDDSSELAAALRRIGSEGGEGAGHPYRDRRESLVRKRRTITDELAALARAETRAERLRDRLRTIDGELASHRDERIDRMTVAQPCRERWEDMRGAGVVRRCARCARNVFDVASMTREEIDALLARADASPCVRLRRRPDGRVVSSDCPPPLRAPLLRAAAQVGAAAMVGVAAGTLACALTARPTVTGEGAAPEPPQPHAVVQHAPAAEPPPPVHVDRLASRPTEPAEEDTVLGQLAAPSATPIRRIDDRTFEIDRGWLEAALEDAPALMHAARVMPHEVDGRVVGVRVYGIRPGSTLAELGLRNGDLLQAIDGRSLATPDTALEAYAALRRTDVLALLLERRGEPMIFVYRIVG